MLSSTTVEFPCDPEPLDSPYYINHYSVEELTYQEITKPGSVIRMQAPRKRGKTSLTLRIINYAQNLNYKTVYIDFQQAEEEVFTTLDKFLRWFCANASRQLQLKLNLREHWDEEIGAKVSCTIYFQNYLLKNLHTPIVLVLNEVNCIFEYSRVYQEFFSLLRSWHEQAKQDEIWQKLRLIVVHSTEIYIELNINESPFNVGLAVHLPEFDVEQIKDLARRYGLNWSNEEGTRKAQAIQSMVGGHPYLVRLAIYHLVLFPHLSLEDLLKEAPTMTGIYSAHLRQQLALLQKSPELARAFQQASASNTSVELDHLLAYKLESMGLVKIVGNQCTVSCDLYRQYFATQNLYKETVQEQIERLQRQIQQLQRISITDDVTQITNKRYFNIYLEEQWQRLAIENELLSLILIDIDHFKIYNTSYGQEAGNNCLRLIANVICQVLERDNDSNSAIPARYKGTELAVILPKITARNAFKIAEKIRKQVKKLALAHDESIYGLTANIVTVSVGVASTVPQAQQPPSILINAAEEALNYARRNGRDRTFVKEEV
jgi:diguanylate cyclase (GGDEF)-like protein